MQQIACLYLFPDSLLNVGKRYLSVRKLMRGNQQLRAGEGEFVALQHRKRQGSPAAPGYAADWLLVRNGRINLLFPGAAPDLFGHHAERRMAPEFLNGFLLALRGIEA